MSEQSAVVHQNDSVRSEENARLWSHALHLDGELVQRGNLYLLGQSMLVVAYAAILAAAVSTETIVSYQNTLLWLARVISGAGLQLGFIWVYVQHRQWQYLRHLRRRSIERLPEYAATVKSAPGWGPAPGALTAYFVPLLSIVMWGGLLLLTWPSIL